MKGKDFMIKDKEIGDNTDAMRYVSMEP